MIKAGRSRKMARRKKKKGSRRRFYISLAGLSLSIAAACLLVFSDMAEVREIRLHGGRYLPMDSLQVIVDRFEGVNMLTLSLSKLEKEIRTYPEVGKITLRRRPPHRIDCYLQTRIPVALIATDELLAVDSDGTVISQKIGVWDIDLPVITGIGRKVIGTESGKESIAKALEVLQLLKDFGFSPAKQLSEIHVDNEDLLLVWMGDGTLIQMGKEGYQEKVRKLRAVYKALDEYAEFPEFIDLRFERQVVIR